MTKLFKLLLASMLLATTVVAEEQKSDWSANVSTGFFSDYMWRGFDLYDGAAIQPSAKFSYNLGEVGSVSYSAWAHLSADNNTNVDRFTEVDHTLSLDVPLSFGTLSVGHIWYTYPRSSDDINDSAEFFGSLAFSCPLNPVFSVYSDYDQYDNEYYELNLSHSFEVDALGEGFAIRPTASFGFASNADKVYADNGLEQITTGVAFDLQLGDVAITPTLNYTFGIDDNLSNQFWMGTTFSYNF